MSPSYFSIVSRRPKIILALGGAILAICLMFILSSAPSASAVEVFCGESTLKPYGQGGDRCFGPATSGLDFAAVVTHERSGCVDFSDTSNNLKASWVCGAAKSAPGLAAEIGWSGAPGVYFKGVIRNNNESFSALFAGREKCFQGQC